MTGIAHAAEQDPAILELSSRAEEAGEESLSDSWYGVQTTDWSPDVTADTRDTLTKSNSVSGSAGGITNAEIIDHPSSTVASVSALSSPGGELVGLSLDGRPEAVICFRARGQRTQDRHVDVPQLNQIQYSLLEPLAAALGANTPDVHLDGPTRMFEGSIIVKAQIVICASNLLLVIVLLESGRMGIEPLLLSWIQTSLQHRHKADHIRGLEVSVRVWKLNVEDTFFTICSLITSKNNILNT